MKKIKYDVQPIIINNPIDMSVTYGVFDVSITDDTKIHCKEPYPNLIVECNYVEHAMMIARILNNDERLAEDND